MGRARWRGDAHGPAALLALVTLFVPVACADFSSPPADVTIQPSLSPAAMYPEDRSFPLPTTTATASPSPGDSRPSGTESAPADPCRPPETAIIAACLTTPWGLAVLPDGISAIVGERTTGRLLTVAAEAEPQLMLELDGVDATGDGGLLGVALSPHYLEDGLLYAFVTTAEDNRILRIAPGDTPKPVFTGIPKGAQHNGGRIAFGADGYLYVATGDAGIPGAGADPATLGGKVLRLDEFGKPAPESPDFPVDDPLSAIYASGLVNPTGMCLVGGGIAVLDRVAANDKLTTVTPGADLAAEPALWSYAVAGGGAIDCAQNETVLAATSLDAKLVTALSLSADGGFTGQPQQLAKDQFGRLLTLEAGAQGLLWATTSNRDGLGNPQPRDDMVVVIPTGGGGEGNTRD